MVTHEYFTLQVYLHLRPILSQKIKLTHIKQFYKIKRHTWIGRLNFLGPFNPYSNTPFINVRVFSMSRVTSQRTLYEPLPGSSNSSVTKGIYTR